MDNSIEISGRYARNLVTSASIADTGIIEKGSYRVVATVDTAIAVDRQTPSPALSVTNGFPLIANTPVDGLRVGEGQAIYAIAGGAGSLKYIRTGN